MKSTLDYLAEIGSKYPFAKNDNRLAELIGISRQTISLYRNNGQHMSVYIAARIAYMLEISPLETIAATMHEQAGKEEEKQFWKEVYKQHARKEPRRR